MNTKYLLIACLPVLLVAANASADFIPYPNSGSYNTVTYSYTAVNTGDVMAYIVGGFGAVYENQMGLQVNGVLTSAGFGLDNHASSLGQSFDLGHANAGDTLTFVLHNLTLAANAYSDPSLNVGYDTAGETIGHNHIYSTAYTATAPVFSGVPAGTYVGFEDLRFPSSDFNYNDESFVFSNVAARSSVPLPPAAWTGLTLLGGMAGMRLIRRRRSA